jgi:hypothetical protein
MYKGSFVPFMAVLQSIFGHISHPHKNDSQLRKWYKLGKSALVNGRFDSAATTALTRILNKMVQQKV